MSRRHPEGNEAGRALEAVGIVDRGRTAHHVLEHGRLLGDGLPHRRKRLLPNILMLQLVGTAALGEHPLVDLCDTTRDIGGTRVIGCCRHGRGALRGAFEVRARGGVVELASDAGQVCDGGSQGLVEPRRRRRHVGNAAVGTLDDGHALHGIAAQTRGEHLTHVPGALCHAHAQPSGDAQACVGRRVLA